MPLNPAGAPAVSSDLAPVTRDLSAYIIAGAVSADPHKFQRETEGRTPAQGIQDGVDAERLGFRRVFISERWDIKYADVILAGTAARTSRLELVTGVIVPTTRQPWAIAALGATMHACFGPRFVLGLGRGDRVILDLMGLPETSFSAMAECANITRRVWAGESVAYDGQLGKFPALKSHETYPGPQPPIWLASFGQSKSADLAAQAFDGVILPPMFTPEATAAAVTRIRAACERIDRDPQSVHIVQPVVTAPEMEDFEARSVTLGRLVTYLIYPGYGGATAIANGWDLDIVEKMRNHPVLTSAPRAADFELHRHQMVDGPGSVLPWSWVADSSAMGTVDECVTSLQRFIDAGADEVTTYGSTPMQNAGLIEAWRKRPQAQT